MARALKLLNGFSIEQPEVSVSELARRSGMHKSTVSRLLGTLEAQGLVRQDPQSNKFCLGYRLLELASFVLGRHDIREIAHPTLIELSRRCGETVNLAIFDGEEAVNVDQVLGSSAIQYVGWVGRRTPAHCSATGKALLAFQPADVVDRLLSRPLTRQTGKTITDAGQIRQQLEQIRREGVAVADEEFQDGLIAVAAPVHDRDGLVSGVISISAPSFRTRKSRLAQFKRMVREAADNVSQRLGPSSLVSPAFLASPVPASGQ